jgi:O-antigen/teichoic acid export membrane protein
VTVIPAALVGVLFPALSATLARDQERTVALFQRGVGYTFLALFPIALLLVGLAPEGLDAWLGADFATHSTAVLQWLAAGVLVNSLARMPFALVLAAGRPDIVAKLHLIELPLYVLALWFMLTNFGITGAAIVWTLRAALDAALLFMFSYRLIPETVASLQRMAPIVGAGFLALAVCVIAGGLAKALSITATLALFAVAAWFMILEPPDRRLVRRLIPVRSFRAR